MVAPSPGVEIPPLPPSNPAERKRSGMAIASLLLGLGSFCLVGPLFSVPAVICGHTALRRIRRNNREYGGEGVAIAGVILGYANLAIAAFVFVGMSAAILLPALARAREAARRAACSNDLKQIGLSLKMFALDNKDERFPHLSPEPGRLMVDYKEPSLYPTDIPDLSVFYCPSDIDSHPPKEGSSDPGVMIDDHSYFYLGYLVTNEDEMSAFAEAYRAHVAQGLPFDADLDARPGAGSAGSNKLVLLREGAGSRLRAGANASRDIADSEIPLIIERIENHIPKGAHVLYLDGHTEFIRYPGKWPMTEKTTAILTSLDQMGPTQAVRR